MCECGCVAVGDRYRLPGPKGLTYEIHLSAPCANCDGPAGVTVHKYDREMAKDCDVGSTPPLECSTASTRSR